jgi:hypothetical protein
VPFALSGARVAGRLARESPTTRVRQPVPHGMISPDAGLTRIEEHGARGRCLVAAARIPVDTVIEEAPVVVFPAAEAEFIDLTVLFTYYFAWPEPAGAGALILGRASMANHSPRPNARVDLDVGRRSARLVAIREIPAGEEISIFYGCDLWFTPEPS